MVLFKAEISASQKVELYKPKLDKSRVFILKCMMIKR
jgi:hypothetical protein